MDFEANARDGAFGEEIAKRSTELIQTNNIRAPPVNLFGSIDSIPDGLEFQKVSHRDAGLGWAGLTSRLERCPPASLSTRLRSRWMVEWECVVSAICREIRRNHDACVVVLCFARGGRPGRGGRVYDTGNS